MTEYKSILINLPTNQWELLEKMTSEHNLKNVSKALRICITCVAMGDVKVGLHHKKISESNCIQREIQLSSQQLQYIQTNFIGASEAIQRITLGCSNTDEYTVFGVVRCKSTITKCRGALDAVLDIGNRYDRDTEEVMQDANENVIISENKKVDYIS